MTQHDIAARAHHYVIALLCVVVFGAIAAHLDNQRDAANQAACMHAEQQAKAAAQPDTWVGLDRDGRRMVALDRIKK